MGVENRDKPTVNSMEKLRPYDKEEAVLRAWEKQLQVPSARERLKQELLAIINTNDSSENRLQIFNNRRSTLLGADHGQGWRWAPSQLWPHLLCFFPPHWRELQPGSKLRKALEKEPMINSRLLSLANTSSHLSSQKFEKKIFSNCSEETEEAFRDLLCHISELISLREHDAAISSQKVMDVLNLLHVIKFKLTTNTYLYLLEKLFRYFPEESFSHYCLLYIKNPQEMPLPQAFIEYYLMASTLVDKFILTKNGTNQRLHALPYLMMVLISIPQALIANEDKDKIKLIEPSIVYDRSLKKIIEQALQKKILKEKNLGKSNHDEEVPLLPLIPFEILELFFKYLNPNLHPLVIQTARLVCEEFLRELRLVTLYSDAFRADSMRSNEARNKASIWNFPNLGYNTIDFLAQNILKPADESKRYDFRKIEDCMNLLNPMLYSPTVPVEYKRSEKYAMEIILQAAIPELAEEMLLKAPRLICINNTRPFSEEELEWIVLRVQRVYPGLISKEDLKQNLTHKPVYGNGDIPNLPSESTAKTTAEAIALFVQSLAKPHNEWEKAIEQALVFFVHFLNNFSADSQTENSVELDNALRLLRQARPYLTSELHDDWKNQLYAMKMQDEKKGNVMLFFSPAADESSVPLRKKPPQKQQSYCTIS